MTQQNVNSGKTRSIRNRSAHRHSDAVHVHGTPPTPSAPARPVSPPTAPAKKGASTGFINRWLGR